MRLSFLFFISLIAISTFADNTTRRNLRRVELTVDSTENVVVMDTIHADSTGVRLSGYEKPLRSSNESIFVTNNRSATLKSLKISIDYTDETGRQLHKRDITLECDIPPGETRQLIFPSWDKQKTMHYYLSPKSRTANGTPYRVKTKVITCVYQKP
ncbi:MAG: hypothetical protein J1E38_09820 [Paramuribaculum sp.]|nr:hypothetical protein [Paramuribaculum sp.]